MEKLSCFKSYDIRGKLGNELNEKIAYRIGRAYGEYIQPKEVVLGCDIRLSSNGLKMALSDGLRDAGVNILDIGLSGTEEVYFATFHLNADGGIEITASHNPIDYNGMKLVRKGSLPISSDTGLDAIKKLAESNKFSSVLSKKRGEYKKINLQNEYIEHLISYINTEKLKPLKLVFNSGNGASGPIIDLIEKKFKSNSIPIEFVKIHNYPDGNFPNGIPNPLLPECRGDTQSAVIENNADVGIAFDGDFDRCFFFDEKGDFIEGYYIVGLLAQVFLNKNKNAKIIHDPRLQWNTIDLVKSAGGIPVLSKTGHSFIKEAMRNEDAIYGGEMSAHHYFRDFAYCDSGMIPWLLIIELLSLSNKSLSQLVSERIEKYPVSGEINSEISNPIEAINSVEKHFKSIAIDTDHTDGLSMTFPKWRFNLRSSNTEPLVRLNVESYEDKELVQLMTEKILSILNKN
ncbi:TPA: phosphomannomutase CpsG [Providencia rettgeri]